MITLAVESSAIPVSVAISQDGLIVVENYVHTKQTHSETLMPIIEDILEISKYSLKDIDLFAVSSGPGSFTGIRIGVSTVKGLAFTNNTPCCAVSTLEAIAFGAAVEGYVLCAVMDARCGQVYNANFIWQDGELLRLCEDRALSMEELSNECQKSGKRILLCGDGALLCYQEFRNWGAEIAHENVRFQRAGAVALIAEKMSEQKQTIDGTSLIPAYLRLSQAERELKNRMRG
ncbi:tRNA (adenosine(37)-N6)-threonylcarbamoyltransferase complex dimerization subunit type 1 TsaB [Scatolibacter rhodanostii]|uniref:tRNA (adenosine(37)-N6)-threonylcarbamoyltransferase complex dimerization subunit type 1 TsaB n=1 Tax=Scatolibacter rhodanostii TaxID=2014781 RepID=UPI000C086057|nr:tRNA (adenosine(37)-N6)-threonylcarbamoyltransferase complex dimerization subunit type 1 TsaB [Scatolibacter rhodanostii]